MNRSLEAVLIYLINKRYIGGKHTPEKQLINSKTKWINKKEKKEFDKEYKEMINEGFIFRYKKRTGQGSDWHLSLNPKKLNELNKIL